MFLCLARYLDELAFLLKFINVDFQAGILIRGTSKEIKIPIIFKFVFITNVAQFSAKEC